MVSQKHEAANSVPNIQRGAKKRSRILLTAPNTYIPLGESSFVSFVGCFNEVPDTARKTEAESIRQSFIFCQLNG